MSFRGSDPRERRTRIRRQWKHHDAGWDFPKGTLKTMLQQKNRWKIHALPYGWFLAGGLFFVFFQMVQLWRQVYWSEGLCMSLKNIFFHPGIKMSKERFRKHSSFLMFLWCFFSRAFHHVDDQPGPKFAVPPNFETFPAFVHGIL